jgi:LacI family transcriptional regulator
VELATIRDVAREAGVSIATVSRVFNGSTRVREDTRLRVWAAATGLDYWPNGAARSLTTNRTHTIGVLLPDLYGEFFSEVIRGIDQAAHREGSQILTSISRSDADTLIASARMMQGRTDGLIVMAADESCAVAIERIRRRFPIVLLNPHAPVDGCCSVSISNREGAFAVVDHLVRMGHTRIATITGPAGNVDADERLRGYRDALQRSGLETDPALELTGEFTESSGYRAAREILQLRPLPTAVFAANDYMALGLLSALREAGLRVPGDMALAGFDDIEISRYLDPPLTTAHVDAHQLGSRAVRLLISHMRTPGRVGGTHEFLPATLVVRSSCAKDAGRGRKERKGTSRPRHPGAVPSPESKPQDGKHPDRPRALTLKETQP